MPSATLPPSGNPYSEHTATMDISILPWRSILLGACFGTVNTLCVEVFFNVLCINFHSFIHSGCMAMVNVTVMLQFLHHYSVTVLSPMPLFLSATTFFGNFTNHYNSHHYHYSSDNGSFYNTHTYAHTHTRAHTHT